MHWFLPGASELPAQGLLRAPGPTQALPRPRPGPRPFPRGAEAHSLHPDPLGATPTRFLSYWGIFILKEEFDTWESSRRT